MNLEETALQLSEIERKALKGLEKEKTFSLTELDKASGIGMDSVRRSVEWLKSKSLIDVNEEKKEMIFLSSTGKDVLKNGLPEKRFLAALERLKGKASFQSLMKESKLNSQEFNVSSGQGKKAGFIEIDKGLIILTSKGKNESGKKNPLEEFIEKLANGLEVKKLKNDEKLLVKQLESRRLIEVSNDVQKSVEINKNGLKALELVEKSKGKRQFNIMGEVPKIFIGKKQPYNQFLLQIRRRLTEMGFREMYSPLIVHEFYNFDVLFQPQNHPARTWSDTYQLLRPALGELTNTKAIKAVKSAHETGGVSASSGWRYSWLEEIAQKLMPAAHGTAHSARQLIKGVETPGKYFAIARCFRPDVIDATHLIEFNQLEGFVVDENLNFRHLLGLLKEFAVKFAGAEDVKFFPDYYPFTEPSVQLSAKHPELGWIELGGAGMFRPEMLENLGIKGQAIAWGIGIDRLAMFKLGIKDIRQLFSQDLDWLRRKELVI